MRAHGTEAAIPVSAVHTCHKGIRIVVRFCSLAHLRLIGRTTVSGRSNQMWSVPHRVMLKFESLPRPAIMATGPCQMQRQLIEKSYGFMGPGIGPPRLRARSALSLRRAPVDATPAEWPEVGVGQLVGRI